MLVRESGVLMLNDLLAVCSRNPYDDIPLLAKQIIKRCERFEVDSDYVTDDEQNTAGMDE